MINVTQNPDFVKSPGPNVEPISRSIERLESKRATSFDQRYWERRLAACVLSPQEPLEQDLNALAEAVRLFGPESIEDLEARQIIEEALKKRKAVDLFLLDLSPLQKSEWLTLTNEVMPSSFLDYLNRWKAIRYEREIERRRRDLADPNLSGEELAAIAQEIKELEEQRKSSLLTPEQQTEAIRKNRKLMQHEKHRQITEIVWNSLSRRGLFCYSPPSDECSEFRFYFFEKATRRLYELPNEREEDVEWVSLIRETGVRAKDREYPFVLAELKRLSLEGGKQVKTRRLWHYDASANVLYLANGSDVLKLTGDKIKTIPNGEEVFFEPIGTRPFKLINPAERGGLEKDFFSLFNWDDTKLLTAKEQAQLFALWVYSLPFEAGLGSKPILLLTGPKGSGKTMAYKLLTELLFGFEDWAHLGDKEERDFIAYIKRRPLALFDNVEHKPKWLEDILAAISTGAIVTLRKLYTTSDEESFKPHCWLALNSIRPRFRRADIADRLLILQTKDLDDSTRKPESQLLKRIRERRDNLLSEYVETLNAIVRAWREHEPDESTIPLRMADWSVLSLQIAEVLGWDRAEIARIEARLQTRQIRFSLEENPVYLALRLWLDERGGGLIEISTTELLRNLEEIASREGLPLDIKGPISLGMWLGQEQRSLAALGIKAEKKHGRTGEVWSIAYTISKSGDEDLEKTLWDDAEGGVRP